MYGNYKNYKNYKKRPYKGKTNKTPIQKAYSAGVKAGLRIARNSRFRK